MSQEEAQARIACCVLLRKGNKVAFVKRSHTSWMNGYYGLIGGRVKPGERYTDAAIREAKEEAGVVVRAEDLKPVLTVHRKEDDSDKEHWVDLFFEASAWEGKVRNAEPHMHSELVWLDPEDLPNNTVPMMASAMDHIKKGTTYAEFGWSS